MSLRLGLLAFALLGSACQPLVVESGCSAASCNGCCDSLGDRIPKMYATRTRSLPLPVLTGQFHLNQSVKSYVIGDALDRHGHVFLGFALRVRYSYTGKIA